MLRGSDIRHGHSLLPLEAQTAAKSWNNPGVRIAVPVLAKSLAFRVTIREIMFKGGRGNQAIGCRDRYSLLSTWMVSLPHRSGTPRLEVAKAVSSSRSWAADVKETASLSRRKNGLS
jgi:hypothetical protein